MMFTTVNDSLNLLVTLKIENMNISEKNSTLAHAPTLRKNPMEPP